MKERGDGERVYIIYEASLSEIRLLPNHRPARLRLDPAYGSASVPAWPTRSVFLSVYTHLCHNTHR